MNSMVQRDRKMLRAVIFDLAGTLAFIKKYVDNKEVSSFLVNRGYEIYPQELRSAWDFVVFIDYPKFGYNNYESMLRKMFARLEVEIDEQTLIDLAKLYQRNSFELYPDAQDAVQKVKNLRLKTAIATTTPRFWFERDIKQIIGYIDFVCTGYEARCEKSNPKMYKRILEYLKVGPQETVAIGDDMDLDILIPKKLGMKAILLNRNGKSRKVSEPDASVSNLHDAMKVITSWMSNTGYGVP